MDILRKLLKKYGNYSLDLIMYGFFFIFLSILILFFG